MAQVPAYFFLADTGAVFLAAALVFVFWTAFLFVDFGDLSPIVLVFLTGFTHLRDISFPGDAGNMHLSAGRCPHPDANIFRFWRFLPRRAAEYQRKKHPAAILSGGAAG
jgi:hypothetical protein